MPRRKQVGAPDFRKSWWLALGHDVGEKVNAYMEARGITDGNMVIRELCARALSSNELAAVDAAYRHAALQETRGWVIEQTYNFYNELYLRLKKDLEEKWRSSPRSSSSPPPPSTP